MNKKIIILDGYTLNPGDLNWEPFREFGELTVYDYTAKNEILARAKQAEIVFTNKTPLSQSVLNSLPKLHYIGVLATGYDLIDIEAAREKRVTVTNIPAYGTESVAQMVFAHILNFTQRVEFHSQLVKHGEWSKINDFCFWRSPLKELAGATLGIIGYGRIGRKVADIAKAFDMKVIVYDKKEQQDKSISFRSLKEVFQQSDFLSLHIPLTSKTKHLVNKETLNLMKPSAFLINTSRGQLINQADLIAALDKKAIAGAGLDVLETEPPPKDNPLFQVKNCFITPHIAWATFQARKRLMDMAFNNLKSFLTGNPINVVN